MASSVHPLLRALDTCYGASKGNLFVLSRSNAFRRVCTYVIGLCSWAVLVSVKPKSNKHHETSTAFGGCDHPRSLIHMINSLRLEMMDEASLGFPEEPTTRGATGPCPNGASSNNAPEAFFSDLFVVHDCLVQVVVLAETPPGLFSLERAR